MICPSCEYEYVDGIKTCVDCNADLIPVDEFEGNLTHPSDFVIIHTTDEPYKAEMIKANLEGADINTLIWNQKDSSYPVGGDMAIVKILVKKSEAKTAIEIINDINSGETTEE